MVSASDVKELRQRTGAGMLACKNALEEAGGNIDEAIEFFGSEQFIGNVAR